MGNDPGCVSWLDVKNEREDETYSDRNKLRGILLQLEHFNQFFLTLARLQTRITGEVLSAVFGLSQQTVNQYYNCSNRVTAECFGSFFREWPSITCNLVAMSAKVQSLLPEISVIIECSVIHIWKPSNPDAARKCYSNYKLDYTVKCLVAAETDQNVCFLSHIYQAAIPDVSVVRLFGFFQKLPVSLA